MNPKNTPSNIGYDINLFLKGEYIKRHFEQESEDIDWFCENWKLPAEKLGYAKEDWIAVFFLSDVLLYHDKAQHSKQYLTKYKDVEKDVRDVIKNFRPWLDKMYAISKQYKICASELALPFDIEKLLELIAEGLKTDGSAQDMKISYFRIPCFIEPELTYGFIGFKEDVFEEKKCLAAMINYTDPHYDIKKIISTIETSITAFRYNLYGEVLTEDEKIIMAEMPKNEDFKTTYTNSEKSRLIGLLHWDLRLKGYEFKEIRNTVHKLGFHLCTNTTNCEQSSCKQNQNCKNYLNTALATAAASIWKQEQHPTVSNFKDYTYEGKKIKIKRYEDLT